MQHELMYRVPEKKKVRVIIHTDCRNEADDQFALAHALMTPKIIIRAIVAGHFDAYPQQWGSGNTAKASRDEVLHVLSLMGLEERYGERVYTGAEHALAAPNAPQPSAGARAIIDEAMRDDPLPLFILCQGALTDLASAILTEPAICTRMTAVWIGGAAYPEGGDEFNLWNDIHAANVLMQSKMPVWQIPMDVYKQASVTLAELQYKVQPCGKIGDYLFRQMVAYNDRMGEENIWPHGETWGLGDQAVLGVLLEELERVSYQMTPAPYIDSDMRYRPSPENREIRVYRSMDARCVLEDFFAKLAILYRS